jgi:hypothetical protein
VPKIEHATLFSRPIAKPMKNIKSQARLDGKQATHAAGALSSRLDRM